MQALRDAVARDAAGTLALQPSRADDDLLQALLGYTPLTARTTVLPFVTACWLDGPGRVRAWLVERLRAAVLRPQWTPRSYQPIDKRIDFWMAVYSFNLTLLVLACGSRCGRPSCGSTPPTRRSGCASRSASGPPRPQLDLARLARGDHRRPGLVAPTGAGTSC